jgi:hypothetical protein
MLVSEEKTFKHIFFIGSYVKFKSSHGGHLEFPIAKRFTSLVQDHPMIIPAKSQCNCGLVVSDKKIFKISANENTLWTLWAMLDFKSAPKTKSGRGPSNEHFWQVWLKSVERFQRRRVKCEKLTDGWTTDAYPWQKLMWPMAKWAKNQPIRNKSRLWWPC